MRKTDYEKLEKSLYRLKEQYKNYNKLDGKTLSEIDKEAVKESVIKRFEVCYDSLWKHLKKYLEEEGLVIDSGAPKKILRMAQQNGVINQEMLDNCFNHIELRIGTAHDYSEIKVEKALSKMNDFIQDATEIYEMIINKQ